ncbi:hypothetical protein ACJMK2_012038 [Sinanodonta woodiana]|uniref:Uncharacterized protein n=1 Tax=Sinanodonta woodiana TaxID=1069815 RepID=A0ABD3VA11_SINWO
MPKAKLMQPAVRNPSRTFQTRRAKLPERKSESETTSDSMEESDTTSSDEETDTSHEEEMDLENGEIGKQAETSSESKQDSTKKNEPKKQDVAETPPVLDKVQKVQGALIDYNLHDNPHILAVLPENTSALRASPMSATERNDILPTVRAADQGLSRLEYQSDIYVIQGSFRFNKHVVVRVQLMREMHVQAKFLDFFAAVRDHNQKWKEYQGKYDAGYVEFRIRSMECFYIISRLKPTQIELEPEMQCEFLSDVDNRIGVRFPKQAVSRTTQLSLKIIPVDDEMANIVQTRPGEFMILAISPCVVVEHQPNLMLQKPATLRLPIDYMPKTSDFKVMLLTVLGDKFEVDKQELVRNEDGTFTCHVRGFSNKILACIKKNYSVCFQPNDQRVVREIALLQGEMKRCRIMSFKDPMDPSSIWMEVILKENLEETITKLTAAGYKEIIGSNSGDVDLRANQIIRVKLQGSICRPADVPKKRYIFHFLPNSKDLHLKCPYEIRPVEIEGQRAQALLISKSESFKRRIIHSYFFRP